VSVCTEMYADDYQLFIIIVLWDLSQSSVEDVCIAWRRGLRRVWGLPPCTHAALIAPFCGLLQLRVELACRCAGFITKCFRSANQTVRLIVTQGVYSQLMLSPIGRNAQNCAAMFEVSISNIASITKRMAGTRAEAQMSKTDFDKLKVISELQCAKHHYMCPEPRKGTKSSFTNNRERPHNVSWVYF